MFDLQRILVPTDFSDGSLTAVCHAGSVARRFHSQVTLLHVNEVPLGYAPGSPFGPEIAWDQAKRAQLSNEQKKRLEELAAKELAGVCVKSMVCWGDPAKVIAQRAMDENSSLIVISTHGHGAFRRFLLGSVTAKVLHDAECPVWTATHLAEPPFPLEAEPRPLDIRHVMCAVSFGPRSSEEICWASEFAKENAARLTLVNAVLDHPPNLPERYLFQWHEEAQWGSQERLRTLLRDLHVQASAMVISNSDIPKALAAAAKETDAGLLVIGRSGDGRNEKAIGSHAYSIICHSPCPVVSI